MTQSFAAMPSTTAEIRAAAIHPRGTRKRSGRPWLTASLSVLALAVPVLALTGLLNPDWYGYAKIFEEGGAWLADQGRDPLFLVLMQGAIALFGADGYDDFRVALGWGFITFAGWLGLGAGWQRAPGSAIGGVGLALAVVNFGWTRFTVQIREGLAMILVLLALRWASHDRHRTLTTLLLVGAALIHSGTALVLLGWLVALLTTPSETNDSRHLGLGLAGGFVLGLLAFIGFDAGGAATDLFDRTEQAEAEGLSKALYWAVLGTCSWAAASAAATAHAGDPSTLGRAVRHWSWLLMPAVFGLLLAEFATDQSLVVIAATARALALFNALLLLLAALRGHWSWSAGAATTFLLIDQGRVLVQALSGVLDLLGG